MDPHRLRTPGNKAHVVGGHRAVEIGRDGHSIELRSRLQVPLCPSLRRTSSWTPVAVV